MANEILSHQLFVPCILALVGALLVMAVMEVN